MLSGMRAANRVDNIFLAVCHCAKENLIFHKNTLVLACVELPDTVLSVYDLDSSSDLNKRIIFSKRVRDGIKIFRALRAPALS